MILILMHLILYLILMHQHLRVEQVLVEGVVYLDGTARFIGVKMVNMLISNILM